MLNPALVHFLYLAAGWGVLVFGIIEFLKNNSISAKWFVKADGTPSNLAQIIALIASLLPGALGCIGGVPGGAEPTGAVMLPSFIICILSILSSLAGSIGTHSIVTKIGGSETKVQSAAKAAKGVAVALAVLFLPRLFA